MKAGYLRISDDQEGLSLGIERQRQDVSTVARMRGWELDLYVDNDVSAYRKDVVRPEFERMMGDLESGHVDGIVVYNLDRFARQPRDLERAIDIYERLPHLTFATVEGDLSLATDDGKAMARVMVTFANKASADTGRRTRRMHLAKAQAGEPVGRRPFGWEHDKVSLHPIESAIARQGIADVTAGKALHQLCREWTRTGVLTAYGKEWTPQTLRNYLRNPRLVGYRTHRREVLLDEQGDPVMGTWEPLLSPSEWLELQHRMSPTGVAPTGRRGARKRLLSAFLRCGVCAKPMWGGQANGNYAYSCSGHNIVAGPPVDAAVIELAYLQWCKVADLEPPEPPMFARQAELDYLSSEIEATLALLRAREISAAVALPEVDRMRSEVAEIEKDRRAWQVAKAQPVLTHVSRQEWESLTQQELRDRIEAVLHSVVVRKADRRGSSVPPHDRLEPVWR